MPASSKAREYLNDWNAREQVAESMLPLIGKLYREQNIALSLFGVPLVRRTVVDILKAHRFARQVLDNELSVHDTAPLLQAIAGLQLVPARIDLGRLTSDFQASGQTDVNAFVREALCDIARTGPSAASPRRDVVLYGFGRIGRLLARILIERASQCDNLRLAAIVVRRGTASDDLHKRASLLRRDSVHGPFQGTIQVDEEASALIINGNFVQVIYADQPDEIDYSAQGIENAVLVDNTGAWRDRFGLERHLKNPGIAQVILTAPGKGDLPNIVYGVNHQQIDRDNERVFTAASCTTNAIVPVLKAVSERFGIAHGHVETCHSYTNDQNLIDNYHKAERRGRSAPLNMVITETGAAKAVAKALPELAGKLTGNAIRVPTPNVSLAILNLSLEADTSCAELNTYLRDQSLNSALQDQLDYINSPEVVSSDFVGNPCAGIVDGGATIVEGNRCVLYVWYDNEYGYSKQVLGLLEEIAGVRLPLLPAVRGRT